MRVPILGIPLKRFGLSGTVWISYPLDDFDYGGIN